MKVHHHRAMFRVELTAEGFDERRIWVPEFTREDIITIISINEDQIIHIIVLKDKLLSISFVELNPLMDAFPEY